MYVCGVPALPSHEIKSPLFLSGKYLKPTGNQVNNEIEIIKIE